MCWAAHLLPLNHPRGRLGAKMRHLERICNAHVRAHPHATPISTNNCQMLPCHAQARPSPTGPPTHPGAETLAIRKCLSGAPKTTSPCAALLARHTLAVVTAPHTLSATPKPLRAPPAGSACTCGFVGASPRQMPAGVRVHLHKPAKRHGRSILGPAHM